LTRTFKTHALVDDDDVIIINNNKGMGFESSGIIIINEGMGFESSGQARALGEKELRNSRADDATVNVNSRVTTRPLAGVSTAV